MGVPSRNPVREVLDRVGDKWSLLVIATLRHERLRFSELKRHVPGVSQRMLTRTLRLLERDGLVVRIAHAEVPPRVEYELSPIGVTLIDTARLLAEWSITHFPEIDAARARYDAVDAGRRA